ncbi:hypothetical protein [Streptacidiphilus sp. P02-A3a]|uniref:hypothetical protein n=1 Tax=Streptacidiphilus sp. P02-A3a TaxID=2704468 RepID=UPI0015FBCA90|nr:hypothetical protein [Streptacidiphilus sp. P02-A3a]QMU72004.1 hypothetical protein GXP74_30985 [Streptacidiphilus sp. P02-A3a]
MDSYPMPTQRQPIIVGPYTEQGRLVRILRHDGVTTVPVMIASGRAFVEYVERARPLTDLSPPDQQVQWADRPEEWPEG